MSTRRNVKSDTDVAADAHERGRDYLGLAQIDKLLACAKAGRHGARDQLLVLMMFRHGLRVSEAIALRRDHVDLAQSRLWVPRLKRGLSVEHPVEGDELRAIRRWLGHLAHRIAPILNLSDRVALELVCESVCGHLVLLASKITKQGVYKSRGYSTEHSWSQR